MGHYGKPSSTEALPYMVQGASDAADIVSDLAKGGTHLYQKGSKAWDNIREFAGLWGPQMDQAMQSMQSQVDPSGFRKKSNEYTIQTRSTPAGFSSPPRPNLKRKITHAPGTPGRGRDAVSNAIMDRTPIFDQHYIESASGSKMTSLSMKLGKHSYKDPIPNFLKNLHGSGTIQTQWGGVIRGKTVGLRKFFLTCFRHRLVGTPVPPYNNTTPPSTAQIGYDCNYQSGPYNSDMTKYILYPQAPTQQYGPTVADTFDSMYYVHLDRSTYYAPLNRADYEDMSWNLNHLKIGQNSISYNHSPIVYKTETGPGTEIYNYTQPVIDNLAAFLAADQGATFSEQFKNPQAALYKEDFHRKQSSIQINNQLPPDNNINGGTDSLADTPHKYDMYFKHGSAEYMFYNKEPSPIKVEVIVYRVKKNGKFPGKSDVFHPAEGETDNFFVSDLLTSPIGVGYVDTVVDKYGTDAFNGRTPDVSDIHSLPQFPFLPELKKTIQSNLPFSEMCRNTFAMPSGAHRALTIEFPGDIYDPANIPLYIAQGSQAHAAEPPFVLETQSTLDSHSFVVCIACSGMLGTRVLSRDAILKQEAGTTSVVPQLSTPIGENYGTFDLQYTCNYTEHVGGCLYKSPSSKVLYVGGRAAAFKNNGAALEIQSVILPLDRGVRVPNMSTSLAQQCVDGTTVNTTGGATATTAVPSNTTNFTAVGNSKSTSHILHPMETDGDLPS